MAEGLQTVDSRFLYLNPCPDVSFLQIQVSFLLSLNHFCLFIYERKLHRGHDAYAVVSRVQEGPGFWKHSKMEILGVSVLSRSQMGGSEEAGLGCQRSWTLMPSSPW